METMSPGVCREILARYLGSHGGKTRHWSNHRRQMLGDSETPDPALTPLHTGMQVHAHDAVLRYFLTRALRQRTARHAVESRARSGGRLEVRLGCTRWRWQRGLGKCAKKKPGTTDTAWYPTSP